MTQKLQKCRSRNFAIFFVDRWMKGLKGGSKTDLTNKISKKLDETFSQWEYVLVVYPPHHGGHKHWTNYDIRRFRHDGHNIVLHFYPLSDSKACKDPEPLKWCNNHRRDPKGFHCTHNNNDAHEWYNWIKNHPDYFGHISALTVFQGRDFVSAGRNVCQKIISFETGQAFLFSCGPIQCFDFPAKTVPLTIIYA